MAFNDSVRLYSPACVSRTSHSLTWSNLDTVQNELRFQVRKTGKRIILPLDGPLATHVASMDAPDRPDAPLHPRAFDSVQRTGERHPLQLVFPISSQTQDCVNVNTTSTKARNAKAAVRRGSKRTVFPLPRHTPSACSKDAGVPAAVVMALTGHDSAEMSQLHTRRNGSTFESGEQNAQPREAMTPYDRQEADRMFADLERMSVNEVSGTLKRALGAKGGPQRAPLEAAMGRTDQHRAHGLARLAMRRDRGCSIQP